MLLENKHVVVYITGSIAVYKSAVLVRQLIKRGAKVKVVMTKAATSFVTPLTFQTLTHEPVLTDLFSATNDDPIKHISLSDWTDLAIVAPASADVIAKIANGLADDAVTTTLLATNQPVFLAPAMNTKMWQNPATKRNISQLIEDKMEIVQPETGFLAEGYSGTGRMAEPEEIVQAVEAFVQKHTNLPLTGKKVLISAGGTREAIDPVRFLSNRSSGKMGYALAEAAFELGANVTLVSTVDLQVSSGIDVIHVNGVSDLMQQMQAHFETSQIVVMAAAVADYRPKQVAPQKLKKSQNPNGLVIELVQNPDILATLGSEKKEQFLVGFAAETEELLENANQKLISKHVDMLVANDVSDAKIGFDSENNAVELLQPNYDPISIPVTSKLEVARDIFNVIITERFS